MAAISLLQPLKLKARARQHQQQQCQWARQQRGYKQAAGCELLRRAPVGHACVGGIPSSCCSLRTAACLLPMTLRLITPSLSSTSSGSKPVSWWLQQVLVHTRGKVICVAQQANRSAAEHELCVL